MKFRVKSIWILVSISSCRHSALSAFSLSIQVSVLALSAINPGSFIWRLKPVALSFSLGLVLT